MLIRAAAVPGPQHNPRQGTAQGDGARWHSRMVPHVSALQRMDEPATEVWAGWSYSRPHILPSPGAVGGHEGSSVVCQAWVCCRSAMGVGGRVGGSCGTGRPADITIGGGRERERRTTREASVDVAAGGGGVRFRLSLPSSSRSPRLSSPRVLPPPFLLPSLSPACDGGGAGRCHLLLRQRQAR